MPIWVKTSIQELWYMEKSTWLKELEHLFQAEKFSGLNNRYYQAGRFIKMAAWIESYRNECAECKDLQKKIDEISKLLLRDESVSDSTKMEYSGLFRDLTTHLRKKHRLQLPGYFSSIYTLLGILGGMVIWFLIKEFILTGQALLSPGTDMILLIFLGLAIGRLLGRKKDNQVKKHGKALY